MYQKFFKRIFDVVVSIFLLIVLSPVIVITGLFLIWRVICLYNSILWNLFTAFSKFCSIIYINIIFNNTINILKIKFILIIRRWYYFHFIHINTNLRITVRVLFILKLFFFNWKYLLLIFLNWHNLLYSFLNKIILRF